MPASPEFTRLFVHGLAWDAVQTGRSLVDMLAIAAAGKLVVAPSGKVLACLAPDGTTVTITLPPRGRLRGRDITKLADILSRHAMAILANSPAVSDGVLVVMLTESQRPALAA